MHCTVQGIFTVTSRATMCLSIDRVASSWVRRIDEGSFFLFQIFGIVFFDFDCIRDLCHSAFECVSLLTE
jgi:hypothetical protein